RWIDANGQRLLFSAKPVSKAPQLAAIWLDQQMKSTAVRYLDWPIGRLGIAHSSVVEHVGIVPVGLVRYQRKNQQNTRLPTNRRAPSRTGRRKKWPQLLDYLAFSEQMRTTTNGEVVPLAGLAFTNISKGLDCQTALRGSIGPQRISGAVSNHHQRRR